LEPITHFLTGAILARTGFNRKTALATATMTLAAEAPDLDVLWSFKGPVVGFAHHRGFTHSFVGLILVSAVVTGFMYLVWRLRGRRTNLPNLPARWGLLFLFAYIAGLSHILLDYTNNYGVRPFWPFWEKWYSWGVAFIVEPPILIILLVGLLLPSLLSRSKPSRDSRGLTAARLALICVVGLWTFRAYEATRIVRALNGDKFNSEGPRRASAYPYWTLVSRWRIGFRWAAVIETRSFFITSDVTTSGKLDTSEEAILPKNAETSSILAAKGSYLGRVYLDWAQYPLVTQTPSGQGWIVHFKDLRFNYPQFRGGNPLSATVELDGNLHVVGEKFGKRSQVPPID
jgi:inner membrane protein